MNVKAVGPHHSQALWPLTSSCARRIKQQFFIFLFTSFIHPLLQISNFVKTIISFCTPCSWHCTTIYNRNQLKKKKWFSLTCHIQIDYVQIQAVYSTDYCKLAYLQTQIFCLIVISFWKILVAGLPSDYVEFMISVLIWWQHF